MNTKLLIDAVVRQTTILIAELATSAGLRAPLAHLANSVFLELATELEAQGISRKVAADMFGMALRSYQAKVQRLTAAKDDEHESLWEAVLEHIRDEQIVGRSDLMLEFHYEDERVLRGILRDLVESGLVFQAGTGDGTSYRFATDEDHALLSRSASTRSASAVVWINVYLHGPATAADVAAQTGLEPNVVAAALEGLVADGRVASDAGHYSSEVCVLPMDDPAGWEASVFDHFNAVVMSLVVKLRNLRLRALPGDVLGGSTYSFEVWDGHPHEDEVLGLLRNTRAAMSELRERVDTYNARIDVPPNASRVTFYFGQSVVRADDELGENA